jgi:hypothetical protein
MQRVFHHTREAVEKYLSDALAIVNALDPPEELRPLAFEKAIDLLSAQTVHATNADLRPVPIVLADARGVRGH